MSFPVLSKEELLRRFREQGITPRFIDPHAIDTVGTCHYHTIKDDVQAGIYSFDHFVNAYVKMQNANRLESIHDVRSFANWLRAMEVSDRDVTVAVESWSKDVAYFAAAERTLSC